MRAKHLRLSVGMQSGAPRVATSKGIGGVTSQTPVGSEMIWVFFLSGAVFHSPAESEKGGWGGINIAITPRFCR